MWKALGWLHLKLYRGLLWLLASPFRAVGLFFVAVLTLLGEEFRRWTGLAVSGAMIVLAGKAVISYAPATVGRPLALTVLLLLAIWAYAAKRAAYYTLHNSLFKVRQRMWFRQVIGEVKGFGQRLGDWAAQTTRGTPVGGAFKANRAERDQAEAAAQAEADRAAREAREAAEREELVAVLNAEHDPYS